MQYKRNGMCKISCCFLVNDGMITKEKIQKLKYFIFLGGGGLIAKVLKLAVSQRTKFRNTYWLEKSLTTVAIKLWKKFCKTSLNARE